MKPGAQSGGGIDDAMNRVLGAEQAAREAVAACREEADAMVARAEAAASAISDRAGRRIRAAHRIADRGVERALAELQSSASAAEVPAPDAERIEGLVAQLARELIEPGS